MSSFGTLLVTDCTACCDTVFLVVTERDQRNLAVFIIHSGNHYHLISAKERKTWHSSNE